MRFAVTPTRVVIRRFKDERLARCELQSVTLDADYNSLVKYRLRVEFGAEAAHDYLLAHFGQRFYITLERSNYRVDAIMELACVGYTDGGGYNASFYGYDRRRKV